MSILLGALVVVVVAVNIFFFGKKRTLALMLILGTQLWLSLHYAAAYRELSIPESALQLKAFDAWLSGVGAMNRYTLYSYIPALLILQIAAVFIGIKGERAGR